VREGWEIRPLGSVSAINYGYTESASYDAVGPRFLRITDIQDDRVDWETVPYCAISAANVPKYRLATGDIVFARTGATTGKSFLVYDPPEAVFASYLIRLRLTDARLLPDFLSLFFQTDAYWQAIKDGSTGSAQGGFNATKLAALAVPIPPLLEQKRIAAILGEAFEGIDTAVANTEKNLANARELFNNYLDSIFVQPREGWVQNRLGDIAAFKNGLNFTKGSKGEIIKIVGVKDFQNNFYVPTSQLEMAQIDGRLSADYELRVGDILTVRSNGNKQLIGRCILASEVPEKTSHSGFTIRIRTASKELSPAYLVHFLKSKASREMLIESGDGANISSLNQRALSALPVTLPPIADQLAIADRIEAIAAEIKNLEVIYQQKLDRLADLKQAILQKAFVGDLTTHPERALPEAAE
jgi:type I restriction enzyme S subunit